MRAVFGSITGASGDEQAESLKAVYSDLLDAEGDLKALQRAVKRVFANYTESNSVNEQTRTNFEQLVEKALEAELKKVMEVMVVVVVRDTRLSLCVFFKKRKRKWIVCAGRRGGEGDMSRKSRTKRRGSRYSPTSFSSLEKTRCVLCSDVDVYIGWVHFRGGFLNAGTRGRRRGPGDHADGQDSKRQVPDFDDSG